MKTYTHTRIHVYIYMRIHVRINTYTCVPIPEKKQTPALPLDSAVLDCGGNGSGARAPWPLGSKAREARSVSLSTYTVIFGRFR